MIKNYVTTIDNQNSLIEMLKSNHEMLEDQLYKKIQECYDLKAKLEAYTKPEVALKSVEQEVFRVKTVIEKTTTEEGKKRRIEHNKEVDEIIALRDGPPSKILKLTPAPPIIPPPKSPKPVNQEAVTSPKSSPPKKKFLKRDRSSSPPPPVQTLSPPTSTTVPIVPPTIVVSAQRKKRKKDKEKKKT